MAVLKRPFYKGCFVTTCNKEGTFCIYEGEEVRAKYSAQKRYSVILSYDPKKYMKTEEGKWDSVPFLEVDDGNNPCEKQVDDKCESYWERLCTDEEIEQAHKIINQYGFAWNEKTLTLTKIATGEIVRRLKTPKIEYSGEKIVPITKEKMSLLKKVCKDANKPLATAHDYCEEYWNGYGRYDEYD